MIEDWDERLRARTERAGFEPRCDRFYFLRHGQTEHNRQRICQGHTDVPLNDTGLDQAETAAAILAKERPVSISASDLMRVRQTADPLAKRMKLDISLDPDLRERAFGTFEDQQIEGQLWSFDHPSIESIEAFVDRSLRGFATALTVDDTLVVTHGGLRRVLAGALSLELPYWSGHNALPLRFTRVTTGWKAEALTEAGIWPVGGPEPTDLDR
ncbi:MAG: histidine phosphatase family protein [Geminicoccaceae bacterium]